MPRRKSSIKKKRADKKRRLRNLRIKKDLKDIIKKFLSLVAAKSSNEAGQLLKEVFSKLDKAAKKKVLHRNVANRKKSRLTKKLASAAKT